jgi:hypothetical protein
MGRRNQRGCPIRSVAPKIGFRNRYNYLEIGINTCKRCLPFSEPANAEPPARADVEAALRKQAARTAVDLIKERARAYAKRPMTLENVFSGLSAAAPEAIIAVAKHLIAAERNAPRRWFGFDAKAILLSARALRRDKGRRARKLAHDF